MLQLWGVGSDERKGDRIAYWGFAWSEASLPPFLQGNIIPHPPTTEPEDYFLTPPFCRSHQKYFYRFLVNTLLEALYLGIQHDSLDGSSAPVSWLNFSAGTGCTGCAGGQGDRAVTVQLTLSSFRKPRVSLKAVTSPGLSHVLVHGPKACTSKLSVLCGVLSFPHLFQSGAVQGTSALLPPDSY